MDKENPLINIILVNYHGHKDTIECINSLLNLNYENFGITVLDNSKDVESLKYIQNWADGNVEIIPQNSFFNPVLSKAPVRYTIINESNALITSNNNSRLTIIKAENKGFAAANNVAIKFLKGNYDWVWLLNNDTVVDKDCLKNFVNHLRNIDNRVGIIGTNLYYYHHPNKLQGIGGIYNKWTGGAKNLDNLPADCAARQNVFVKNADYVIGASMFVSKNFINDVGFMNEKYFLYFEEIDWAIRGNALGYKLGYACDCNVYHKEGASIGSDKGKEKSELADYYSLKNKVIFTRTFYPNLLPAIYCSLFLSFFLRIYRLQFKRGLKVLEIIFKDR